MKKLVIVESPNKIKSIERYLGANYIVMASVGHIVKLPSSGPHGFGVDLETWIPNYKLDTKKKKIIKEIKNKLKEVDEVFIATDPDREGEAIGENLVTFLEIENKYSRIKFNEITETAIQEAIKKPTKLDIKLVNSQVARRILDRIIGYQLSKLMQRKIKNSPTIPSAGRVQSIALKLVAEKEKIINSFVPVKYSTIEAIIEDDTKANFYLEKNTFENKTWIEPSKINEIKNNLPNESKELIVKSIKITKRKEKQIVPLKQSALYRKGNSSFGMSAKAVQSAAQRLYEGYGEGGLISYPRTDSTRLSNVFLNLSKKYILKNFGKEYLSNDIKGTSGDQDAHEAIRPTFIELKPNEAKDKFDLSSSEFNIYKLIWTHTMQSLMTVPIRENLRYELYAKSKNIKENLKFKLSYSKVIFDGYYKVTGKNNEIELPEFKEDDKISVKTFLIENKQTQPPARYNDGSLIEKLDEIKVGRPSTFATTVSILKERFYVELEGKTMKLTEFGGIVNEKLAKGFPDFINEKYTAVLENDLNLIAKNEKDHKEMLSLFWESFEKLMEEKMESIDETIIPLIESDKKCPNCDSNLVIRTNKRNGDKFLACPLFPKCKHIESLEPIIESDKKCPNCNSTLIIKTNKRRGNKFLACPGFPKCKHIESESKIEPKKDDK